MGADQTQVDSQKKTSKYSFREFWLPAIGSAILIKLIGPLPGVVAFITFVWLKPKLGILMAIAFSAAAATATAALFIFGISMMSKDSQPTDQGRPQDAYQLATKPSDGNLDEPIDWEKGVITPPGKTSNEAEFDPARAVPQKSQIDEFLDDVPTPPANAPTPISLTPSVASAPINDPRNEWRSRTNALRRARDSGALQIIDFVPPSDNGTALAAWQAQDVAKVEQAQTWWVEEGTAWIHVKNPSFSSMGEITFTYIPRSCGEPTTELDQYRVRLDRQVPPGAEALIRFAAGDLVQPVDGCLIIIGIRG